jgi:hypothetical protein
MAIVDFDYESQEAGNKRPPASPHSAGEVYCESGKASIDASYINADMIGLVKLPHGCVPIDCILKSDQLLFPLLLHAQLVSQMRHMQTL